MSCVKAGAWTSLPKCGCPFGPPFNCKPIESPPGLSATFVELSRYPFGGWLKGTPLVTRQPIADTYPFGQTSGRPIRVLTIDYLLVSSFSSLSFAMNSPKAKPQLKAHAHSKQRASLSGAKQCKAKVKQLSRQTAKTANCKQFGQRQTGLCTADHIIHLGRYHC